MSLHIEVSPLEGYLRVQVTGRYSFPDANPVFVRTLEAVSEHEARRVMVDCIHVEGSPSTMERYWRAVFAAKEYSDFLARGVSSGIRFAYVAKTSAIHPDKFGETVAVNRGIDVRVFDCADEAMRWLEADSTNNSLCRPPNGVSDG